jgi:hypothetical protein
MLVMYGDEPMDYDLDFVTSLFNAFDNEWVKLKTEADQVPDPDAFGILDDGNYLAGIGFTACQQYFSAVYSGFGLQKGDALNFPPQFNSKVFVAVLLNEGANYWKHHEEWSDVQTKRQEEQKERTLTRIESSGVSRSADYLCMALLGHICGDVDRPFANLIRLLVEWRDSFLKCVLATGKTKDTP